MIGVVENSSDENMARNVFALAGQGNSRIETHRALSLEQATKIFESVL
jgi:uncharacterized protein with GYD domain